MRAIYNIFSSPRWRRYSSLAPSEQHIASREEKAVAAASAAAAPAIGASNGAAESLTVVTSAPGKVILFGEHAVVYGKTAVAAAVSDLRIVATVVRRG